MCGVGGIGTRIDVVLDEGITKGMAQVSMVPVHKVFWACRAWAHGGGLHSVEMAALGMSYDAPPACLLQPSSIRGQGAA